ncbi:hypothetical protein GIB67_007652 [Kingdonia uniflora]|uniref:DNA-directed RNA polymerase n=1 Tax=Kingdonia uniflora TaxID=39325 RepID=A0A7J7N1E1_9MAGN|nr:hypothetical protein GIB67_007652 [Kingdonia uniflora]
MLVLNRLTYASTLSHLRRLNSPIGHKGKLAKPCQLHNSEWGMMCPAETPEGQVLFCIICLWIGEEPLIVYVIVGSAANPILEFLKEWTKNFEEISPAVIDQAINFFVNGCGVGIHRSPDLLANTLRRLRRQVLFSILGNFGLSLTN